MKTFVTLCLAASLFGSARAQTTIQNPQAHQAVESMRQHGLVEGPPGTRFNGPQKMSRKDLGELLEHLSHQVAAHDRHMASAAQLRELQTQFRQLDVEAAPLQLRMDHLEDSLDGLQHRT